MERVSSNGRGCSRTAFTAHAHHEFHVQFRQTRYTNNGNTRAKGVLFFWKWLVYYSRDSVYVLKLKLLYNIADSHSCRSPSMRRWYLTTTSRTCRKCDRLSMTCAVSGRPCVDWLRSQYLTLCSILPVCHICAARFIVLWSLIWYFFLVFIIRYIWLKAELKQHYTIITRLTLYSH